MEGMNTLTQLHVHTRETWGRMKRERALFKRGGTDDGTKMDAVRDMVAEELLQQTLASSLYQVPS